MSEKRYYQKACYCSESVASPATDCWSDQTDGYCPLQQMGQQELPLEIHKLIVTVFLLVIAGFTNWAILAYIHDFVPRQPLPDIFSSLVPEQKWALKVGDVMVTLTSGCMISIFILHKHRAIVIRRILFILAVLYFFRAISMISTQLPSNFANNNRECRESLEREDRTFLLYLNRVLEQSVHFGLQDTSQKMLCGDMLYSGHTLIMMIASLTVEHYLPNHLRLCQYIPKFFTIVGVICLLLSRVHYTIDIAFAYFISVGVFSIYHAFCEIETYRERKQSVLYRLWIMRLVGWLEENVVPGKIENVLTVPILPKLYRKIRGYINRNKQPQPTISSTSSTIVTVAP